MGPIAVALIVVVVIGAAIGLYALLAPRSAASPRLAAARASRAALQSGDDWNAAGEEFASLSESARCDMIFTVATRDDDRSQRLLRHALDDAAEPVALAAAHALAGHGHADVVQRYLDDHPGERAERMAQALTLLAPEG